MHGDADNGNATDYKGVEAMVMRTILFTAALTSSGCSWLFQDRLSGTYTGRSEPRCTTSGGWAVADGLLATVGVAGALVIGTSDDYPEDVKNTYILGGILDLVIHGGSAISGGLWAAECERAYAKWNSAGMVEDPDAVEERPERQVQPARKRWDPAIDGDEDPDPGEIAAKREQLEVERKRKAAAAQPRGFFCASSATAVAAGLCARGKADCTRARDAAVAVIADMTECTLVETVQCFDAKLGDLRCSPTMESCAAQRERAAVPGECREER
jgi:hypothetical protein